MIDPQHWRTLRRLFARTFRSSLHFTVSSVAADGAPVVTPIGSLVLLEPGRALYLELYAGGLGRRLDADPRVSVLAVDSGRLRWLRALLTGRFEGPPAVRLVGRAVPGSRPAADEDLRRFARRVGVVWRFPGARKLWGCPARVRELAIERIEPVGLGPLTPRGRLAPSHGS